MIEPKVRIERTLVSETTTHAVTPFNMLIVGKTKCGKTHYLLRMLETEYMNHFDYIFLICPTYSWNKTYQEWTYKDDDKYYPIECSHDQVEDFLGYIVAVFAGTNSLIILDDCASSQTVKNRTSELINLAFSARHYGLSTVVITQQMTSIAKPYRDNTTKLVTFHNKNCKDMQTLIDENLDGIGPEEEEEIRTMLRNNKYARLEILHDQPSRHRVVCPEKQPR